MASVLWNDENTFTRSLAALSISIYQQAEAGISVWRKVVRGKGIGGSDVSGQRANKQCGDVFEWLLTPNSASGRRKGGRERSHMVVEEMHSSSLATLLPLDIPLFRLSLCTVSNDDVVDTFNAQWCTEVSADCFPAFET